MTGDKWRLGCNNWRVRNMRFVLTSARWEFFFGEPSLSSLTRWAFSRQIISALKRQNTFSETFRSSLVCWARSKLTTGRTTARQKRTSLLFSRASTGSSWINHLVSRTNGVEFHAAAARDCRNVDLCHGSRWEEPSWQWDSAKDALIDLNRDGATR